MILGCVMGMHRSNHLLCEILRRKIYIYINCLNRQFTLSNDVKNIQFKN